MITEETRRCAVTVVTGCSTDQYEALLTLLHSILRNYPAPADPLCIYVLVEMAKLEEHRAMVECALPPGSLMNNTRILFSAFNVSTWTPVIRTGQSMRPDLFDKYNWARFYIRPTDIGNVQRMVWLDCDCIVRRDIGELYRVDLRGRAVATGFFFFQTLHNFLCQWNPNVRSAWHCIPHRVHLSHCPLGSTILRR